MRHRKAHSKLSMMSAHRKATLRNMVRSLLKHQKIETIHRRAKEVGRLANKLITISKEDTVLARRKAYSVLCDRDLVAMLFNEIAPLFKNRTSGYTRVIPLGFRRGDGAAMAILELTEKKAVEKAPKKGKAKDAKETTKKAPEAKDAAKKGEKAEKAEEPKKKKDHKPTLNEEKAESKAKAEDKKIGDNKKFMTNLRGFFHRKNDM